MIKPVISGAVFLGAVLVVVHSSVRASTAAVSWLLASDHAATYGSTRFVDREVETAVAEFAPLASLDRGVLFVLSPECSVCSANMSNWTDLIVDLKNAGVPMFAVAPAHAVGADEYWAEFHAEVPLIQADARDISSALGVSATPTTVVLRRGRIRAVVPGVMSEATRRQLFDFVLKR